MTLDELKAMHGRMTPGILKAVAAKTPARGGNFHIETADPVTGFGALFAAWLSEADALGVVTKHNHFAELMRRFEAAIAALKEAENGGGSDISCCPVCDRTTGHSSTCSLGLALAAADAPLGEG